MSFQCIVVTPEQQLLDQPVTQVIIPAFDGLLGILTDRSPLLAKLGIGPLRVDVSGGASQYYLVEGGVAQMKDNKLTIVTQKAIPADEIKADVARAEYEAAIASKPTDEPGRQARQVNIQRAQAKQAIARN